MSTEEFKENILPYHAIMFRVAASVMKSGDEAADAVQDAIERLWEKRDLLKNVNDLKSYAVSVVRNICLNNIKRKTLSQSHDEEIKIISEEDIHNDVEWRDYSDFFIKAMNRLPPEQRYVLRLSAYGGFSNAEIADLLGISQGNVRVILSRARSKLKEFLSK